MSVTQVAFAFFLLLVAPGFGMAGALMCRGTKLRWFGGLAMATLAAWFGLACSGVVAALCHPRYPVEGPPEHVALLYLAPGFVLGIAAVLALGRLAPPTDERADNARHKRGASRLLALGVLLSGLVLPSPLGTGWCATLGPGHRAA